MDTMDAMDAYRELIKENIDYDILLSRHSYDGETIEVGKSRMAAVRQTAAFLMAETTTTRSA